MGVARRRPKGLETQGAGSWPAPTACEENYFFLLAAFFLVVLFFAAFRLVVRFFAALRLVAFLRFVAFFLFTAIFTSGGSELRSARSGRPVSKEPEGSSSCPGDGVPGELPQRIDFRVSSVLLSQ